MEYSGIEIHTLICNKDLLLAINNFKSLQKFEEFADMPVFLHDDGSLSDSDIEALNVIKNVTVIRREYADKEIVNYVKDHLNCLRYRVHNSPLNLWHKIKLFDYMYFSKTKKVLGMDTDLLFIRKPEDVINYLKANEAFYYPDIQDAYCYNEPKDEIPVVHNINTGLIYIPSEDYFHLDALDNALGNLLKNNINYFPAWIEQSAFAHMFYVDGRYKVLGAEKYRIPYFQNVDIKVVECLHFVSYPAVRDTYKTYTDYLEFSSGDLIHQKELNVDFKGKTIPLEFKIFKNNGMFNFEYYWGLEKTDQQFLDHIFEIETEEGTVIKKLQSNKNSFFVLNTKSNNVSIRHSYDWYGETNWVNVGDFSLG